jgi:hypothetical protein
MHRRLQSVLPVSRFALFLAATVLHRLSGVESATINKSKGLRIPQPKDAPQSRSLQSTTTPNFRARYVALFSLLLDASCTINSPQLEITCNGEIVFENTSDPSIQCVTSSSNTLTCTNTCADSTACSTVYLAPANGAVSDGPFGEIYFQCLGDTVDDVKALLNYEDNGDGTCGNIDDRVFKTGRLAVSCDGGTSYIVDDYFFECGLFSYSYVIGTDQIHPSEQYACIQGNSCGVSSCSIPFNALYVSSTPNQFDASCIESLNGLPITPAPTSAPVVPGYPVYQATFQTAWGLLTQGTSVSTCASNALPTVRVQCLKGGSIDFVDSESSTISCTKADDSTLECSNSESIMNYFPLVTYVSIDCTWPMISIIKKFGFLCFVVLSLRQYRTVPVSTSQKRLSITQRNKSFATMILSSLV